MQHMGQSVSISDLPIAVLAGVFFVFFLGTALVIHARNQVNGFDEAAPKSLAWARCSRRFYWAAVWAAIALITPMVMQFFALMLAQSNPSHLNPNFQSQALFLAFVTLFGEVSAVLVSIGLALHAVTNILPRFELGDAIDGGSFQEERKK